MYKKWLELGLNKGIKALEFFVEKRITLNISVYKGVADKCVKSEVEKVKIRGIYRGKMGVVNVENLSDDNISLMLDELMNNAKALTVAEPAILYKGAKKYPNVPDVKSDLNSVPLSQKLALLVGIENKILANKKVSQVETTVYGETQSVTTIVNSKGLNITRNASYAYVYSIGVFGQDDDIQTAMEMKIANNFSEFDSDKIAKTVIKKGLAKLGGSTIASGPYPVVFENEAFSELLSTFQSVFSAEACYRNLTPLKGKEGQALALESITLSDDPFYKKAFFKIPFDDEGVPCKKKKLIDKGVFTGFINDLKSAKLLNAKPTGNSFGGGISPTNLILEPGKLSLNEVLASAGNGVYIDSLVGLHVGVNTSSGDFSLQASGFLIKDGKLDHPVKMIVVSGNFYKALFNVKAIGKDINVYDSGVGSPSVCIDGLVIGGK